MNKKTLPDFFVIVRTVIETPPRSFAIFDR